MFQYIAHTRDDSEVQPLYQHLTGTAELARKNAAGWGEDFAYCCGLAHDIGKYSEAFQRRIRRAAIRVDHATAGGKELYSVPSQLALLAAYCIMGHHGGMPNGGAAIQSRGDDMDSTLHGRLKRKVEDYQHFKDEITLPALAIPELAKKWTDGFDAAFFARMVFSSLVDADWLDTENFCNHGSEIWGGYSTVGELWQRLAERLESLFDTTDKTTELNIRRGELLRDCVSAASSAPGLFRLTAPTGSGKTISSLAFALKHAAGNGMKRVIYVIPYNTIIDQNSAVFEELLGQENVLRHNSDVQYDGEDDEAKNKRFSVENWDFPVIVTSSVQFFESLFSNKPSKCRKLHNIAGSCIIFDEAQMIPLPFLHPCIHAIETLVTQYGCTAVLSTATQSAIDTYFKKIKLTEISKNLTGLFGSLRRTTITPLTESLADEDLAERLLEHNSVLCIVNTRLHAQSLFKALSLIEPDGAYHLSTTMYPAHRKRVLDQIRERLQSGNVCRVISTSLVEAGVDLDFDTVYREEAGLDSIIQAAGRCNREGKRSANDSAVYVFSSAGQKPPRMIEPNIGAYRQAAKAHKDISGLDAIEAYFSQLFYNLGDESLDLKGIIPMFNNGVKTFSFPFEEAAKAFKLIDDSAHETVYCLKERPGLEERLHKEERTMELIREIGPYAISLYGSDIKKLRELRTVDTLDESVILLSPQYYEDTIGVPLTPEGGQGFFS
jgi:CRISPR-associated endonuclease/helicase Cas3